MTSKTATSKATDDKETADGTAGSGAIKVRVTVYPRPEIFDPQGKAVHGALQRLGFEHAVEIRAGKSFEVSLTGIGRDTAVDEVRQMCQRLLANPVIEDFSVELVPEGSA